MDVHEVAWWQACNCRYSEVGEYCLSSQHPRGRHKARVFASVGILDTGAEELRTALLAAAGNTEAKLGIVNPHGQRYVVDFDFVSQNRIVMIRSSWIVRAGEDRLRMTSCYG